MTALAQAVAVGNTQALAATTVAATLASAPTPGNLLVAVVQCGSTSISTISWGTAADVIGNLATQARSHIYSKIAGVGESATVTATLVAAQATHRIFVYEFSATAGMYWNGPDQVASNFDAGAVVSTLSSGTTPATTSADQVAVAGFSLTGTVNTIALTNGFAVLNNGGGGAGHKILSATGTQETTATWGTARRVAASIATYKQGPTPLSTGAAGFLALL